MPKIKFILFLLLIASLISGCDKDTTKYVYDYKGESEHWEVYYHENSSLTFWTEDGTLKHDSSSEVSFTAVYKKDLNELDKVRQLEIGYDTGLGGSSLCENYDESPPNRRAFTITSSNGLVANEVDVIQATLRIDDYTETIELTRK